MDPISIAMGLAQFAPSIIKWITGSEKAGEAAGKVIEIAQAVTGKPGADAVDALRMDPALALKFRESVMAQEADLDKAYLADKANARARDVEFVKGGRYNYRADVLAFLACAGLILCVYLIAKDANLPERAVNAIMFVAGVFASAVRDVFSFEFGSSRGSREKDNIIKSFKE